MPRPSRDATLAWASRSSSPTSARPAAGPPTSLPRAESSSSSATSCRRSPTRARKAACSSTRASTRARKPACSSTPKSPTTSSCTCSGSGAARATPSTNRPPLTGTDRERLLHRGRVVRLRRERRAAVEAVQDDPDLRFQIVPPPAPAGHPPAKVRVGQQQRVVERLPGRRRVGAERGRELRAVVRDERRLVVGVVAAAAEAVGQILRAAGLAHVLEVVEKRLAVRGEDDVRRLGVAVDDRLATVGLQPVVDGARRQPQPPLPALFRHGGVLVGPRVEVPVLALRREAAGDGFVRRGAPEQRVQLREARQHAAAPRAVHGRGRTDELRHDDGHALGAAALDEQGPRARAARGGDLGRVLLVEVALDLVGRLLPPVADARAALRQRDLLHHDRRRGVLAGLDAQLDDGPHAGPEPRDGPRLDLGDRRRVERFQAGGGELRTGALR
mmetsp:Transcript_30033/g.102068  ORF Transcript_30033/g.102068 Transcript_30033/m.102068 type:complete len:444 (+) Transcript_30033:494-1825(+)